MSTEPRAALAYWAMSKERAELENKDIQMSEERAVLWKAAYMDLAPTFTELSNAEAKLLLLGEEESQKLIRAYGDSVKEFRGKSFRGGDKLAMTDGSEYDEYRAVILSKREALFRSLSAAYKR